MEHHYLIVKVKWDHYILEVNGTSGFCLVSKNLASMVSNYNRGPSSVPIKTKEAFFGVNKCMHI